MKKIICDYILICGFLFNCCLAQASINIQPGQTWNDSNGNQINAHGGCVIFNDGYYYWFGEDRTGSVCNGVSCYRSSDLYNWKRLGLALTPIGNATDDNKDIAKGRTFERPKVIYNETTKKWVMWVHWENGINYGAAKVCVAESEKIEGPYVLCDVFRPNEHDSRDQTLFKDIDGNAYHFCATNMNTDINISRLNNDYLTPSKDESLQLNGQRYEAPAIFRVGDIYYGLFSGCSGWDPNKGRYAYSYDILNGWVYGNEFRDSNGSHGINFCVDLGKDQSYSSQSAYVVKLNGYDKAFIYMGDRWNSSNVGSSKYVWLPLSVRSGYPTVRWFDSWNLSVFDEMYRFKRAKEIIDGSCYYLLEKRSNRLVSRAKASFTIEDDDTTINSKFIFHKSEKPYVYKIQESKSGKYLESVYGTIRMNSESDKIAQDWMFFLEEDGYYRIQNCKDDNCLSLSGACTFAGSSIFLNPKDESIPQSFAVYFDSKNEEYEEADMFSKTYHEETLLKMKEQEASSISSLSYSKNFFSVQYDADVRRLFLSSEKECIANLQLVEISSGRIFLHKKVMISPTKQEVNIPTIYPSGVYLLSLRYKQISQTVKLLIL